jgi:tetratricopeptide (TPR) repeat protein
LADARQSTAGIPNDIDPVLWEMRALIGLGRVEEARKRLDAALAMLPAPDWTSGEILLRAADEFRVHEHADYSREILLRALAWYRALPDSEAKLPRHRRYRAATLLRADSLQAAERAFRELAADSPNDSYYIASVAVSLARQGEREAAVDIVGTALQKASPYDYGHNAYERARVVAQLGDADAAIDLLNKAFAQGFKFAFVGGIGGTAGPPDGRPHLDPAFDGLRRRVDFQALERGK